MAKRITISLAQESEHLDHAQDEQVETTGSIVTQDSEQEQSQQSGAVVIPLEESEKEIAEILAVEELSEEIAGDQAEVERSIEVAEGLEDVASIAENIEQPSPTDIALIQTAANMAVAGTDGDASELVPAAESITSGAALAADLRERISYANEGIMDAFKGIGEKLETLAERIGEKLHSFIGRVMVLRETLKASDKTKFTIKIKEGDFSVAKGVKISTAAEFTKAVNQVMAFQQDVSSQASQLSSSYQTVIGNIFDNVKANTFFKDAKAKNASKYFGPIMEASVSLANTKSAVTKNTIPGEGSSKTVLVPALGDYSLVVTSPDKASVTTDGMGIKDFVAVYKKYDVSFEKNVNVQKSEAAEFEVNRQYLEGLVASIEKLAVSSISFVKQNSSFAKTMGRYATGFSGIFNGSILSVGVGAFETNLLSTATQSVTARAYNINGRLLQGVEKMSDNVARGLLRVALRAVNGKEEVAQESFNV